jgi:hypothetical protein
VGFDWEQLVYVELHCRRLASILFCTQTREMNLNTAFVKSARAMWKVLMVQNWDNDTLEGLAVANSPKTLNPLFRSCKD